METAVSSAYQRWFDVGRDSVESLKNELELRFAEEQEETSSSHAQQLQAAKMELSRAMDLIRQKAKLHLCCVLRREIMWNVVKVCASKLIWPT